MKEMGCPLCEIEVFSEAGSGCKMCGMPLDEFDGEFCSERCEINYHLINKSKWR